MIYFELSFFFRTDLGEEMELQPITPTTLARSREDEECRQLDRPVDDEPREIKLSVARPRDMPREVMRRVRPPSISGNLDHPQIISPEDISLDPCTVGEETPLEEGSFLAFGKRLIKFLTVLLTFQAFPISIHAH